MNVIQALNERKSIRGYKEQHVPKAVLREILEIAARSPSAVNTQPWEFTVITGDPLNKIREENVSLYSSNYISEEIRPAAESYIDVFHQRRVEVAKQLFKAMGIGREDKEKRTEWMKRGMRFFDAPAAIIISMDESLVGSWAVFDIGTVTQSICLAAMEYGLGTCIESQGVRYPEVIRKYTDIPDTKKIVIGIAIGYPDTDFPANGIWTARESIDKTTSWKGF